MSRSYAGGKLHIFETLVKHTIDYLTFSLLGPPFRQDDENVSLARAGIEKGLVRLAEAVTIMRKKENKM